MVDEHLTSIDGKYNLAESIDEELSCGMFNPTWQTSWFLYLVGSSAGHLQSPGVDSSKVAMVRAADVDGELGIYGRGDKETYPASLRDASI